MLAEYASLITKALLRVYDVADESPLSYAGPLSQKLGNEVYIKREDTQPVFSFKLRGAYNIMSNLSEEALARGVICSSAGNHAQGVALAAKRLGIRSVIVMPRTTPQIKVKAVQALGGETVLHGDVYDDAYAKAIELKDELGLTYIHPYDAPLTIAGQGTIGFEIMKQFQDKIPDIIFMPVGGGGLAAGVSAFVKYHYPSVKIITVEAHDSACMKAALDAGERVLLPHVGLFADGTAVKIAGEETFRICRETVDESMTVSNEAICAAIKDIFENTRTIVEPAGALAIAGLKKYVKDHSLKGKTLVAVNSGANVNFDRLRYISEQAEMGEDKEIMFAATMPEVPGSYKKFCNLIGSRNVTEFNYRFNDAQQANVFVGLEISDAAKEKEALFKTLNDAGFDTIDLSNDELAQLHIKHMIGGKAPLAINERLFRVMFPERPGAMGDFLQAMDPAWNISLFHYRNYGSAFGKVLIGMQIPESDNDRFEAFREKIKYTFVEETDNPAYRLFL